MGNTILEDRPMFVYQTRIYTRPGDDLDTGELSGPVFRREQAAREWCEDTAREMGVQQASFDYLSKRAIEELNRLLSHGCPSGLAQVGGPMIETIWDESLNADVDLAYLNVRCETVGYADTIASVRAPS